MTDRGGRVFAAILAIVPASGTPPYPQGGGVSAEVAGLEALPHRPLVFMGAGSAPFGQQDPCESGVFALYEDGLVIYTRNRGACPTMSAHIAPHRSKQIADAIADGLVDAPHWQDLTNCTDQGGLAIQARRGTRWGGTRVDGLDRFGKVTCTPSGERPYPNTLAALSLMVSFDVLDAVPWVATDFTIELSPAAIYPREEQAPALPWPAGLPPPDLDSHPHFPLTDYDVRCLPAARSIESTGKRTFVSLNGVTWAYRVAAGLPASAYRQRVDVALSRAAAALDPNR